MEDVESVWVELRNTKGQKTLVGVVYRPPNSSSEVGDGIKQKLETRATKAKQL